ncbi:MAG: hypothetical protein WA418_16620 [Bradyrhizobium sp.]
MRVYLVSCLAAIVLAVGGYFLVNAFQEPTGVFYTTEGARIEPSWSSRHPIRTASLEDCNVTRSWRWIVLDFKDQVVDVPCRR